MTGTSAEFLSSPPSLELRGATFGTPSRTDAVIAFAEFTSFSRKRMTTNYLAWYIQATHFLQTRHRCGNPRVMYVTYFDLK